MSGAKFDAFELNRKIIIFMNTFSLKLILFSLFLLTGATVFAQTDDDYFKSGEGGFKINLPKEFSTVNDHSSDNQLILSEGKMYSWSGLQAYNYTAAYYKVSRRDGKPMTAVERSQFLQGFKAGVLKSPTFKDLAATEKKYSFNGNAGTELQFFYPRGKVIIRFFMVKQKLYSLGMTFNTRQNEAEIIKILDSFQILDAEELKAVKIEEATPAPLPQEPVAPKLKTDAQDENLKGKVKTILEDNQEGLKGTRRRLSEEYYNEAGNLVKKLTFDAGYPMEVEVWGYIDGNRVNTSNYIEYDDDQRPPRMAITAVTESTKAANLPRDTRYTDKFTYQYDEQGRLAEKKSFGNNGSLWSRQAFSYKDNVREISRYGFDGARWSHTFEVLDAGGNVVEEYSLNAKGVKEDINTFAYEFDAQGNWIVQKAFEKKIVRGKPVTRPLWTSYRTITYYP